MERDEEMKIGNMDTDKEYACPNCIEGNVSCREVTHGVFVAECNRCGWKEKRGVNAKKC